MTFHFREFFIRRFFIKRSENKVYSRIFCIVCFAMFLFSFSGINCTGDSQKNGEDKFRVGVVFDAAGKDDKSFNASAWRGASRALEEFDIVLKDVEPGDPSSIEPAIRALAEDGFDLIFGIGFASAPSIESVSADFPDLKFSLVDYEVKGDNVSSVVFEEHKGAFLVGMMAAMANKSGIIGFVGGMDIPLIRRFVTAYRAGAEYVKPEINVLVNYAGVTVAAWADPTRGKELALSQYSRGADVVYAAAGATGMGIFDAAGEVKKLVIGNDSNQNWIKPGFVLTSMLKRLDIAVYTIIRDALNDNFKPGKHVFGLENNGVGYVVDEYNKDLVTEEMIEKVEKAKEDIMSGKLKVPDYYETMH